MYDRHQNPEQINTRRLFLALVPDQQTINRLVELQKAVKGRKTPRENFHLTLMFLGDQPESRIPELMAFMDSLVFQSFDFRIDRSGFFSRLKISWVGSNELHPALARLHETFFSHLEQASGYAVERKRPFRPHITLARNAQPTDSTLPAPFVWHVDRLALMESIISKKPGQSAVYRILHEKWADSPWTQPDYPADASFFRT